MKDFATWQAAALDYLGAVYCLDASDIEASRLRSDYKAGDTPAQAIDAWAARYGLTKRDDWTAEKAARFMARFA